MTLLRSSQDKLLKANFHKLIGYNPVFRACTRMELERTFQNVDCLDLVKGQVLFCKGDWPKNVFLIESGGVKIVRDIGNKKEVIIRFVGKRALVGIDELLGERVCTKSAICVAPTKVYLLPKEPFLKLIYSNITCFDGVIDQLTKDLVFTRTRIVSLSQKTTSQRLAESLLWLNDFFGIDDQKHLKTSINLIDLTSIVGTTLGNLYKLLTLFESMGLILYKNNKLLVIEPRKLTRIANAHLLV